MPSTFTPFTWTDGTTPITAAQLNRVETGVESMDNRTTTLEAAGSTAVTIDGTPAATLAISSVAVTAADVGALSGTTKAIRLWANASGQSLPSGSITTVALAATEFNTDTAYYTVASNTITVVNPGKYLAGWSVKFQGGAAGERASLVAVSGSVAREAQKQVSGTLVDSARGSDVIRTTAANATVQLQMWVSGGTAITVVGTSLAETGLSLTYLGI